MSSVTQVKRHPRTLRIVEVPAAQFKAKCLELMDRVCDRREEFVITKRGKRVAKLVPVEETAIELFGYMKDAILSTGDIISPIDEAWEADRG